MGNCLDRTLASSSDESDENTVETRSSQHRSRSNRYAHLTESSSSLSSTLFSPTQNQSILNQNRSSNPSLPFSQSYNGPMTINGYSSSSLFSTSLPLHGSNNNNANQGLSSSFSSSQQVYYLTPNVQRTADQLTEDEQIKLLKRMTLIQQLPSGAYDENKKNKECVICMIDFEKNDTIKYLPCMHTFHQSCIDTWLVRSLICPSCMEPVDAGLLAAYE